MAVPVPDKVILPLDTGNTGKKVRTQTRVIGADTVHEHFFIRSRQASLLGVYRHQSPQGTIAAAAQNGTATGHMWGMVPTATLNKWVRLRRAAIESMHSTALATPTAPRLIMQRLTFTGTASGASFNTIERLNDSYPAPVLELRTVPTGITPTLGAVIGGAGIVGAITAVGAYAPVSVPLVSVVEDEDEWPIFKPGQGFVIYQDTAGTTADTRKFHTQLVWDEIDAP